MVMRFLNQMSKDLPSLSLQQRDKKEERHSVCWVGRRWRTGPENCTEAMTTNFVQGGEGQDSLQEKITYENNLWRPPRKKQNDKGADNFPWSVHGNLKSTSCYDTFHLLYHYCNKLIWRLMGEAVIHKRTQKPD